jgi:hypothetical protein
MHPVSGIEVSGDTNGTTKLDGFKWVDVIKS